MTKWIPLIKEFPDFISQVSKIQQEWLARMTLPLDKSSTIEAITRIYQRIGLSAPQILFYDSPYACLKTHTSFNQPKDHAFYQLLTQELYGRLKKWLDGHVGGEIADPLWVQLEQALNQDLQLTIWHQFSDPIERLICEEFEGFEGNFLSTLWYSSSAAFFQGCFAAGVLIPENIWFDYQQFHLHCSWIFPYPDIVFVSERPMTWRRENNVLTCNYFIEFKDGYTIWAWQDKTSSSCIERLVNNGI